MTWQFDVSRALFAVLIASAFSKPSTASEFTCRPEWRTASLTNYVSHPAPDSAECKQYNGCSWAGQFYGLPDVYNENWVSQHSIVAVHLKDWDQLGMKVLHLRQGAHEIYAQAIDACSDTDRNGCCTANLKENAYLVDVEKYTMERFGSGDGQVEFQICD
ncbi:MAG: hypothetical protein ACJA06_001017 [Halocynthiibacter sp.]|jgi:hypothetical protein